MASHMKNHPQTKQKNMKRMVLAGVTGVKKQVRKTFSLLPLIVG